MRHFNVDAQTIGTCDGNDGLRLLARRAARAALAAPTVPCGSAVGLVKGNDEARPNGRGKSSQSQSAVSELRNAVSAEHKGAAEEAAPLDSTTSSFHSYFSIRSRFSIQWSSLFRSC
jgi:hypothetical protein